MRVIKIIMEVIYVSFIISCFSNCRHVDSAGQKPKEFDEKLEDLILSEKQSGLEYFIKVNLPKEVLEYRMTYLGAIDNAKSGKLNFIYSTVYTGVLEDSKRASSVIVVYIDRKRMGQYYVGGGFNKMPIVSKDEIVISYNDDNCNQTTRISFRDSIPQEIFVQCKEQNGKMFGDIYSFSKDNK